MSYRSPRVSSRSKAFALTALLLASTCGAALADPTTIKVATVAWIGYAPFYVAADKGLFEKYGVKVELQDFADPAQIPAALESGSLAGAMYTYDQVITLVANGHDYRVVMPIDYSAGADAIVASNSIKTIADLKGKTVAYPFSTCDNVLVAQALASAGLSEADVNGVDTTPENVAAALASGAAAGSTYEPNVTKILAMQSGGGYHLIYTSATAPGLITDVLYFSKGYIEKNPKIVDGVIKGYLDGMAYMKSHPDDANVIIGKHLSSTVAEVQEQFKGVHNVPVAEMKGYFVPKNDTQSLFTSGKAISEILIKRKQITQAPKTEDTFDKSFVDALVSSN
jgi:NitT/TauT family transport system substrate-binding protein